MKKYAKVLSVVLVAMSLFTGCENFLSGGNLKEELQDMLDYQYAEYISIKLDLSNEEGTAKTNMDLKKKPTDSFTISFTPSKEYAFIDWEILFEKNENEQRSAMASDFSEGNAELNEVFDAITLTSDDNGMQSFTASIKKTADLSKITVRPHLERRPEVTSSSPAYNPSSISRQTPIVIQFSQEIDEESFRFSAEELVALGVIKSVEPAEDDAAEDDAAEDDAAPVYKDEENFVTYKDEDGKYFAYKSKADSFTYFKNIEITTDQGIKSVADSFMPPELVNSEETSSAILTVKPYSEPDKLIDIGNADYKTIIVKLAKEVTNKNGIEFAKEYSWGYQVNEETPEKARIQFVCNPLEGFLDGTLPSENAASYNISQKIALGFTEDADYQFIRWDYDGEYLVFDDCRKINANALVVKDTTLLSEPIKVKAVCAPRLKVTEVDTGKPVTEKPDQVYRNSSLQIKFSNEIPSDNGAGKEQLENINLTIGGGNTIKQCYKEPVIVEGKSILFTSDKTNRLEIPEGQTKTVTLSVPSDFYYEYVYKDETYKVTLGKDYILNYVVSYETDDNAEIRFDVSSSAAGNVTVNPVSEKHSYAPGSTVTVSFELNDGWIFKGWKFNLTDDELNEKIRYGSTSAKELKLEVLDEIKGVVVTADCTEMLKVTSIKSTGTKNSGTEANPVYNKDTGFEIKFNNPIDENSRLSDIKITADGDNVTKSYAKSLSSDRKTVTVTNTKRINIARNVTKDITVTVPKSFCYTESGTKIGMNEEYSESFTVNYMTAEKAIVSFSIINGEDQSVITTAAEVSPGTLTPATQYTPYNLDETIDISFAETADYQFYKWECDSSAILISGKGSEAELTVNGAVTANVKAVVYARPVVKEIKIDSTDVTQAESTNVFAKDSDISIKFAHNVDTEALKKIKLTYTGDNFSQDAYFKAEYDSVNKILTYKPIKILAIRSGYQNETVTLDIPSDVYYVHKYNGTERTTILSSKSEGITRSYTVRNETKNKTKINYNFTSGSLTVDGVAAALAESNRSTDDSINYVFTPSADSRFTGWKVECASGTNYTVEPEDYASSGTVTVKSGTAILFTLQIDGMNPEKATGHVNSYISTPVTICASERLVAKVNGSISPAYDSKGVNCDTPIMIPFNKEMNRTTLSLYKESDSTGTIQIVNAKSAGTHYEKYYEIKNTGWNGNTLTISPKEKVYEILSGNETADVKVILDSNSIKDAAGKILEGSTEFTYRLNPTTDDKTKIKFNLSGCTVKVNGANDDEGIKQYNIGTVLEIECIPAEGYKFTGWSLGGVSDEYVKIDSSASSKTRITVLKSMGATQVNVTPQKVLLPKIIDSAVEPSYNAEGVNNDSVIVIPFNKEMNKTTIRLTQGSIQIVNKDNGNVHYEEYFNTINPACWNGNILTITPKEDVYKILGVSSTVDLKVILGNNIKDNEIVPNSLSGTTSFTYKITSSTSKKTKIQFPVSGTNCTVNINGTEYNSTQAFEYNIGQELDVDFIPYDGYACRGANLTNTDNAINLKSQQVSGNTVKYKIKVQSYSNKTVKLAPNVTLIPKVIEENVTPLFKTAGVECDAEIVIPFNKEILKSTLTLYDMVAKTGNIQIINSNTKEHLENYFEIPSGTDATVTSVRIRPLDTLYTNANLLKIFGSQNTIDLKIILADDILDNYSTLTYYCNKLEGTKEFTYRINTETSKKTKILYRFSNSTLKVNGEQVNSETVYSYSVGKKLQLEYTPSEEYRVVNSIVNDVIYASIENAATVNPVIITKKSTEDTNIIISARIYQIPIASSMLPEWNNNGVNFDAPIKIQLNKEIGSNTASKFILPKYNQYGQKISTTENVEIVSVTNENEHYEMYFNDPTYDSSTKQIIIRPKTTLKGTVPNENNTLSLKVKINSSAIRDTTGLTLEGNSEWTYKINGTHEMEPPTFTSFTLYKPDYVNEGQKVKINQYTKDQIHDGTADKINNIHINNLVKINCLAEDTGSGVYSLIVKEKLVEVNASNNLIESSNVYEKEITYDNLGNDYFDYTLLIPNDGIVKLDFYLKDVFGNVTEQPKTYYVIKDTFIDDKQISFSNFTSHEIRDTGDDDITYSGFAGRETAFSDISEIRIENSKEVYDLKFKYIDKPDSNNSNNNGYNNRDRFYNTNSLILYSFKISDSLDTLEAAEVLTPERGEDYYDSYGEAYWPTYCISKTVDANKDFYVKIIAKDSVNNEYSFIRAFPKKSEITKFTEKTEDGNRKLYMDISNYQQHCQLADSIGADGADILLLYRYQENSTSPYTTDKYLSRFSTTYTKFMSDYKHADLSGYEGYTDDEYTPPGLYSYYIIPRIYFKDEKNYLSNYYGPLSGPYYNYHDITNPNASEIENKITNANLPSNFTVNKVEGPANSGIYKITIVPSTFTKTPGLEYKIKYCSYGTTDYEYSDYESFNVNSGDNYIFYYCAVDSYGNEKTTTYSRSILTTTDNVPPAFMSTSEYDLIAKNHSVYGSKVVLQKYNNVNLCPQDYGYNGQLANGLYYYVIPNLTSTDKVRKLTEEQLNNYTQYYTNYNGVSGRNRIELPLDIKETGYYTIYVKLTDTNGNYSYTPFTYNNAIYNGSGNMSITKSGDYMNIIYPEDITTFVYEFYDKSEYFLQNRWKPKETRTNVNILKSSGKNIGRVYLPNSTTEISNRQVPVMGYGFNKISACSSKYMFKTKFLYAPYHQGDIPAPKIKNILKGYDTTTYQIVYDAPVLVCTVYSNKLLDADPDLWETMGIDTDIALLEPSENSTEITSYYVNTVNVPSGYYYTLVAHFADGSSLMTDIKQK